MPTRLRTAIVLLAVAGMTGIWLVLAPFLEGYQAAGDPWITATINHVVTGALLTGISLVTILTVIGTAFPRSGDRGSAPDLLEPAEPTPDLPV
jgi:hypothetical protein